MKRKNKTVRGIDSVKILKVALHIMRNEERMKQSLQEKDASLTIEKPITEFCYNEYCSRY